MGILLNRVISAYRIGHRIIRLEPSSESEGIHPGTLGGILPRRMAPVSLHHRVAVIALISTCAPPALVAAQEVHAKPRTTLEVPNFDRPRDLWVTAIDPGGA